MSIRNGQSSIKKLRRILMAIIFASSLMLLISVLFLPWRDIGMPSIFQPHGSHLYQMGLPAFMGLLILLSIASVLAAVVSEQSQWWAVGVAVAGGLIMLVCVLVQQTHAESVVVASSTEYSSGYVVAFSSGLLTLLSGIALIAISEFDSRRSGRSDVESMAEF